MTARPIRTACLASFEAAKKKAAKDGYFVATTASYVGMLLQRFDGHAATALDEARLEVSEGFVWATGSVAMLEDIRDEDAAARHLKAVPK